jgi:hypothetical protein
MRYHGCITTNTGHQLLVVSNIFVFMSHPTNQWWSQLIKQKLCTMPQQKRSSLTKLSPFPQYCIPPGNSGLLVVMYPAYDWSWCIPSVSWDSGRSGAKGRQAQCHVCWKWCVFLSVSRPKLGNGRSYWLFWKSSVVGSSSFTARISWGSWEENWAELSMWNLFFLITWTTCGLVC